MEEVLLYDAHESVLKIKSGQADADPTATLNRPDGTTEALTVTDEVTVGSPVVGFDRWSAAVPADLTTKEQEYSVSWSYDINAVTVTRELFYNVVTPYITPDEIVELHPELSDKPESELRFIESTVREVIDTYTQQRFGKWEDTVETFGSGTVLLVPGDHVVSITSVAYGGYTYADLFEPSPSGWAVHRTGDEPDLIRDPRTGHRFVFKDSILYTVVGTFGWEHVPNAVKKAAGMLVGEYFCSDSAWRNKYVKTMRAADWRVELVEQAYEGTGHATADQILLRYVNERLTLA